MTTDRKGNAAVEVLESNPVAVNVIADFANEGIHRSISPDCVVRITVSSSVLRIRGSRFCKRADTVHRHERRPASAGLLSGLGRAPGGHVQPHVLEHERFAGAIEHPVDERTA